jgi:hypothetical protein
MIYTAPYVMFLTRANPLRGEGVGGWALEIETFLGPVKWNRAEDYRVITKSDPLHQTFLYLEQGLQRDVVHLC